MSKSVLYDCGGISRWSVRYFQISVKGKHLIFLMGQIVNFLNDLSKAPMNLGLTLCGISAITQSVYVKPKYAYDIKDNLG